MHIRNINFQKSQTKRSEVASTLWDKLLELLGLPQLEPVAVKIFEKRQSNYVRPNRHGAK